MKNLLILIVAVALFLHFYPQPEVDEWFSEQKNVISNAFSEATDTKVRLKADKIYTDLKSQLVNFSLEEQQFLKEITSDRKSVKAFFTDFCNAKQQSPHLHRDNQAKVCKTIAQYSSLL
jgi:hypothetical protein